MESNTQKAIKYSTLMGMLLVLRLMVGCGKNLHALRETNQVFEEELEIINKENIVLAGRMFSTKMNDFAVVLAHSGVLGEDQEGLHPLGRDLAKKGITALTFDFKGCGKTGGEAAFAEVDKDARAAIATLRGKGYTRIACIGVGIGGTACAKIGHEANMVGMVLVSTPTEIITGKLVEEPEPEMIISKLEITAEDLQGLGYPILIIVAEEEKPAGRPFAEMAKTMYG